MPQGGGNPRFFNMSRVLGGSNAHSLKTLGTASKSGFETKLHVAHKAKVYEVQALDGRGHVLGTSKSFTFPKPPPTCFYNC